jgi:hypothetical protein
LKPRGRGRRFWRDVTAGFDPGPDERELLAEACRMLDLLDELRAAVKREGLTAEGSQGQPVSHPLLAELRHTRAELRQLLRQLDLEPEAGESKAARSAREAAEARWAPQRRRRGAAA